jgi:hypothetical protein
VGRDDSPKPRGHPIVAASGATGRARDARLIEARRSTVRKEIWLAREISAFVIINFYVSVRPLPSRQRHKFKDPPLCPRLLCVSM